MQTVAILVRLKIPDVTALTASNALRRSMGYSQLKQLGATVVLKPALEPA